MSYLLCDKWVRFSLEAMRCYSFCQFADVSVEGIFQKNGNIRQLKDLTEAIDRDPSSVDLTQENPIQLAALVKKFLRDLPNPLMTFKLHKLFLASQSVFVSRTNYFCVLIYLSRRSSAGG
jgi:hypothetical protein